LHTWRVECDARITLTQLERPEEPDAEGWPVHASNIRSLEGDVRVVLRTDWPAARIPTRRRVTFLPSLIR